VTAFLQVWGNQSALNPHGPLSDSLAQMSWIFIAGFSAVHLATIVILVIALVRARRRSYLDDRRSWRLVMLAGLAVPFVVLVAFLIYSVSVGRQLYAEPYKEHGAQIIHVNGKQWWWDVTYKKGDSILARTANEIHIPVGQPVVFELETSDVIHSFWVPSLAGKLDLIPARTNYLWLQADKSGVYRGQCAEYCGAQHAHMGFEVIAEPAEQYSQWLQSQMATAIQPSNDPQRHGQQVFMTSPCVMCHAIRGTQAFAQVGPDLTHLAARRTLASATLPNSRTSLGGWVSNAQGIKPGNHMPRITLPPQDLEDLIAYLESLK
jgi:cytochrome c oxidase subunit II